LKGVGHIGGRETRQRAELGRAVRARNVHGKKGGWAVFRSAMVNYRVWMLFVTYGACFGVELFVHNVAASYYVDRFKLICVRRARPRARSAYSRCLHALSAASSRTGSRAFAASVRARSAARRPTPATLRLCGSVDW
jgi:hypothetical protein